MLQGWFMKGTLRQGWFMKGTLRQVTLRGLGDITLGQIWTHNRKR